MEHYKSEAKKLIDAAIKRSYERDLESLYFYDLDFFFTLMTYNQESRIFFREFMQSIREVKLRHIISFRLKTRREDLSRADKITLFIWCVILLNHKFLKIVLEEIGILNQDISFKDNFAIRYASFRGKNKLVSLLLSHEAKVNESILRQTIDRYYFDTAILLIKSTIKEDGSYIYLHRTNIFSEMINKMIENNINIHANNNYILTTAIDKDDISLIRTIVLNSTEEQVSHFLNNYIVRFFIDVKNKGIKEDEILMFCAKKIIDNEIIENSDDEDNVMYNLEFNSFIDLLVRIFSTFKQAQREEVLELMLLNEMYYVAYSLLENDLTVLSNKCKLILKDFCNENKFEAIQMVKKFDISDIE